MNNNLEQSLKDAQELRIRLDEEYFISNIISGILSDISSLDIGKVKSDNLRTEIGNNKALFGNSLNVMDNNGYLNKSKIKTNTTRIRNKVTDIVNKNYKYFLELKNSPAKEFLLTLYKIDKDNELYDFLGYISNSNLLSLINDKYLIKFLEKLGKEDILFNFLDYYGLKFVIGSFGREEKYSSFLSKTIDKISINSEFNKKDYENIINELNLNIDKTLIKKMENIGVKKKFITNKKLQNKGYFRELLQNRKSA